MKSLIFLFVILSLLTANISGADIRLRAHKSSSSPRLDGSLNEPVWLDVEAFSGFKMVKPTSGINPSEKTEIKIVYDTNNLYIGVTCFIPDPSAVSITDLKQDQDERSFGNDLIRILIDPFQDRRNAYVFFVTAGGARSDGLATGEHMQTNWDGIWDAKVKVGEKTWVAEIRIPFKTINFNPNLREWGFNVERYIAKKMEVIRMAGISRDSHFYNPAEAAVLTGIEGIRQGLGLTFKPYFTTSSEQDHEAGLNRKWKVDGGFDLYKNFTPNLVGVVTYNTDFAETEVDDRRINLTRFPLFFPEKRAFFLEGSEIFSFGSGLWRSFVPFFSRKIGLVENEAVPIEYGAKVFGKIGQTSLNILDVKTRSTNGVLGRNFFAGRIYRNILAESKVGLIFTHGSPTGDYNNTLVGIDFNYNTRRFMKNKNLNFGLWAVNNWNEIEEGKHYGYGFRVDYPNDLIDGQISYKYFGDALEPGLGFLPRNGNRTANLMLQFKPRPEKGWMGKVIRQHRFMIFSFFFWDLEGNLESSMNRFSPIHIITESGERLEFQVILEKDILNEPFGLSDDVAIPAGPYNFNRYKLEFNTASHRSISGKIEYTFGGYYGGNLSEIQLGLNLNHKGKIAFSMDAIIIRGDLPQGDFDKNLYRFKNDLYLNPDLGLLSYIQYDDVTGQLGANIRFKWRISPGNVIYLVYNKGWERSWDPRNRFFLPLQERGVFKIQYTWRP